MAGLKMGNGLDDGVALDPLVNEDGLDKVIELVDDAVQKGAKVLTRGKVPGGPGFFIRDGAGERIERSQMLNEEIFDTVRRSRPSNPRTKSSAAPMTPNMASSRTSTQGSEPRHSRFRKLEFGMIGLNRGLISDPAAPFGGVNGRGSAGGAHEGLMEFLMEDAYISVTW